MKTTLSEKIATIAWAFDSKDSRRDDIRKLAKEAEAAEDEREHLLIALEKIQENGKEHKGGKCEHDCSLIATNALEDVK